MQRRAPSRASERRRAGPHVRIVLPAGEVARAGAGRARARAGASTSSGTSTRSIFLLFLGILLATAIEPIVNHLRRGPFGRGTGVLAVYTAIVLVLGIVTAVVVPEPGGPERCVLRQHPGEDRRAPAVRRPASAAAGRGRRPPRHRPRRRHGQQPDRPGRRAEPAPDPARRSATSLISFMTVFFLAFYWLVERATIKRALLRLVPAEPGAQRQHRLAGGGAEARRLGARPAAGHGDHGRAGRRRLLDHRPAEPGPAGRAGRPRRARPDGRAVPGVRAGRAGSARHRSVDGAGGARSTPLSSSRSRATSWCRGSWATPSA